MKALKPVTALIPIAALALDACFILTGGGDRDLRLTDVTAAPIEGAPGAVALFLKIRNRDGTDRPISA